MKYKCINSYFIYDDHIMDSGDIIEINGDNLYNITKGTNYQNVPSMEEIKKHLESITDDTIKCKQSINFTDITNKMYDTYKKKNHDYGNSFDESLNKFGLIASVVRLGDKMNRLESLVNKEASVEESMTDTLLDMANYCIMTVMWLNKH